MINRIAAALALALLVAAAPDAAPTSTRALPGKMAGHGVLLVEAFTPACEVEADREAARLRQREGFGERLFARKAAPSCARTAAHLLQNLIVDAGEQYLVGAWIGTQTLPNMKFHGLGSSATAAAETQTGCLAEFSTQYQPDNTRATGTLLVGAAPNIILTVGTNTFDVGVTVREWCLMSTAGVGTGVMWSRIVVPDTVVPINGSVATTYNLTIE